MTETCEIIKTGNINIARLQGRIDGSVAQQTKQKITDASLPENSNLLLDFNNVNFIDSMGLGLIASLANSVRSNGGEILLFGMSDQVRASLEATRMHLVFDIFDNEETARRWLA